MFFPPPSPLQFVQRHTVPALAGGAPDDYVGFGAYQHLLAPHAGEHFTEHLLHQEEESTGRLIVREHLLRVDARDHSTDSTRGIMDELGGPAWAPISFSQFWHLLNTLKRERRYIAYVRAGGTVLGIGASWVYKGRQTAVKSLFIESGEMNRPAGWGGGAYVLSQ